MDMTMQSAVPDWLTPVAWTYIAVSLLSAGFIAFDIYVRGHRRDSVATELVWIAAALYLGPFAVPLHRRQGRAEPSPVEATGSAVAVLPGGGASAVAHLLGVPLVAAVGWTIAGMAMWPMILVIAVLAIAAAVITVVAFDIGMVGWMLLLHLNNAMPPATESTFWFLMQVGIVLGLLTGYPAVRWLLRRNQSVVPA